MRVSGAALLTIALLTGLLGACVHPGMDDPPLRDDPPVSGATLGYWRALPDCVVVLPARVAVSGAVAVSARTAERALARHLSDRVADVIGPDRRAAVTRERALDLRDPDDRARYAALTGCAHGADLALGVGRRYAVIWTEATVVLDARLIELETGAVIWRGRHRERRGDGGLPVSPVGLAVAIGRAGGLAADGDLMASVLADGLRALVSTLPDIRPQAVSRNSSVRPLSSRK